VDHCRHARTARPHRRQRRRRAGRAPLLRGAVRLALLPDGPTTGLESTIPVDDVDAVALAVTEHGGRVLMEKTAIPGVGELVFFADPAGNVAGAMRYFE
jgi:predicted enzyme related to lactoylglutathione lyase